jgi:hypothetical protein
MRLEARRERTARTGFVTGIDLFSAEEQEKQRRRAAKFGLPVDGGDGDATAGGATAATTILDPDDDPAELARRRARAERFGVPLAPPRPPQQRVGAHDGVMDVDALEAPADAPPDAAPRPEAVYLYGVDLLSTGDCLRYFTEYGPTFVEWINDSACVVLFADGGSAARAMRGTGVALPPEEPAAVGGAEGEQPAAAAVAEGNEEAMDGGEAGEGGAGAAAAATAAVVWYRGRDYVKAGTAVRLLYRGATQADRRDPNAPKPPSRYLWKTVAGGPGPGSKRGRDRGGGGDGGERRFPQQQQRGGGRRRRGVDGSYQEVDMVDADGGEGGDGGGDWQQQQQQQQEGGGGWGGDGGRRRRVRARRRDRPQQQQQDEGPWQEGGGGSGGGQQDGGDGQQQQQGRRGRGRRMAGAHRPRARNDGFLEVN